MEHIDVSQEIIDAYARDGCVHIPGAFAGHWQERLFDATNRIVADHRAKKKQGIQDPPDETSDRVLVYERYPGRMAFRKAVENDPDFHAWMRDSCAAELVAKVIQSSQVRYFLDTSFLKEKSDSDTATPMHHDIAAHCFKGTQVPSLWIALSDVGEDDAPLMTVLGSHQWQDVMFRPPTAPDDQPLLPGYQERSEIQARIDAEKAEWKTWLCAAGDALIIHPYTVHASTTKQSEEGMRIGFSTRWLGDDVRWAPNIYSGTSLVNDPDSLSEGDLPPDDEFPVVWSAA